MVYPPSYVKLRNFDQTWRAFYHFGKKAVRKPDRQFKKLMNTRGEQFRRRIRGKTKVANVEKKKVKKKSKNHRQDEDYRVDPISNVSQGCIQCVVIFPFWGRKVIYNSLDTKLYI